MEHGLENKSRLQKKSHGIPEKPQKAKIMSGGHSLYREINKKEQTYFLSSIVNIDFQIIHFTRIEGKI